MSLKLKKINKYPRILVEINKLIIKIEKIDYSQFDNIKFIILQVN